MSRILENFQNRRIVQETSESALINNCYTSAIRILLVEDDVSIALLLASLLESDGYKICGIETREADAIAAAAACEPDFIIMDIHLGSGSGLVTMATIQKHRRVPFILMSGDPPQSVLSHWPTAVVLGKPFTDRDLRGAIADALATEPALPPI